MKQFILALFLFFYTGVAAAADLPPTLKAIYAPTPAKTAKPFTVIDPSGNARNATRSASKLIVLNFWATWCAPCLEEMPTLEALQKAFPKTDLEVVSVSVDRTFDDKARTRFAKKFKTSLPLYWDSAHAASKQFVLAGVPTTYILRGDGRVIGRFERDADWAARDVQAYIKGLLKE